jgi:DNA-binding transcriptional regulator YhcF (GntR family)
MAASTEQREHAVSRSAKLFALLKQAADRGEACPTNRVLAERFGCGTARVVSAFHFLESNGMIAVERDNDHRVVTIRATGHRTSGTIGKPHWSARVAA